MTHLTIVYHSGYGHTALVAEAIRDGAMSVEDTEVALIEAAEAESQLDRFDATDGIVFGAPTYMGSASAPMKSFIDATSKPWFELKWKDKIAGGFTNSGNLSGDKQGTLIQFVVLAAQHGMIWVPPAAMPESMTKDDVATGDRQSINRLGAYVGVMAQSENAEPGPDNPPKGDIATAKAYGVRLAKAAKRWGQGTL
ncbi:Flavodoxin/nitric oxide synthase [Parvularcula bermudensis HTCC2503]|uniref:Flavodoxin/nitric oxide synthase n=1 Tax=Parvularcula bermudensis (strain ATCC BAA-594 / HTCC2503 / KCTC 12087) TaxID=314260 RepID=E0TCT1_PARBH|nr:flavodoxin family protein [Parvularcula bermudensis]ADM09870.1 Flavodoxin/nitric oxide synthase [Parvularcula bermudensis HTCC2503]